MKLKAPIVAFGLMACVGVLRGEDPGEAPQRLVESARLMGTIEALPTARSGGGDAEHLEGLARTEELIAGWLRELGLEPELQAIPWAPRRGVAVELHAEGELPTFHNIIVDLPGTDLASEVLIVGAHFDAVPGSPGADDNGTGVAAVLEIARLLRERPMRRTVRLIFFNLEEEWLIGSQHYAREYFEVLERGDEKAVGMMSLDMLGYFSDEPGSQRTPIPPRPGVFEPPTVGDNIVIVGLAEHRSFSGRLDKEMRAASPELETFAADFFPIPTPDVMRSDHAPFLRIGVPAVMVTDTANFRNPHYHTATDTIETIDAERFTQVVQGVVGAVYAMAEPAQREPAEAEQESDAERASH